MNIFKSIQSSVSHDSSEIISICWFGAQEHYLLLLMYNNKQNLLNKLF